MSHALSRHLLELFTEASLALSVVTALLVYYKGMKQQFKSFFALTVIVAIESALWLTIVLFHHQLPFNGKVAYAILYYGMWVLFVPKAAAMMLAVHSQYLEALAPFPPLRRLGLLVFRWVVGVAIVIALGITVGPHVTPRTFVAMMAGQFQQFINILIVCLILFVGLASKPLSLPVLSRSFGVLVGLAAMTVSSMVEAAWISTSGATYMFSAIYMISAAGGLLALTIWSVYFIKPEPARKTLLVPTTSPYFLWNSISEALGDAPGFVAVSGLAPDMFCADELEVFAEAHPQDQSITVSPTLMRPVASAR